MTVAAIGWHDVRSAKRVSDMRTEERRQMSRLMERVQLWLFKIESWWNVTILKIDPPPPPSPPKGSDAYYANKDQKP